jgi:ferric-dicitrate binding protein FerR (iron transport regulator)
MNTGNDDSDLTRLYRSAARERSPAWLDAQILEAAAHHARTRRSHTRLRLLAIAAAFAGVAIAIPRWQASQRDQDPASAAPSIDRHSALADALRRLPVARVETSVVASCLRRTDLCSNETSIAH